MAALPDHRRAAQGRCRLGSALPAVLDGKLLPARWLFWRRTEKRGKKRPPGNTMEGEKGGWVLPLCLTRRGNSCSRRGRIQSAWPCGGVPTDLLTRSASWTYGPAEPFLFLCAAPTASSIP